jgi:hypothetical protein
MQFREKPSEILFAISKPVGLSSKLFILPSGNVMFIIIRSPYLDKPALLPGEVSWTGHKKKYLPQCHKGYIHYCLMNIKITKLGEITRRVK